MNIRAALHSDCADLANISLGSFEPWDTMAKMGSHYLQECFFPHAIRSPDCICLVAESESKILGYVIAFTDFETFSAGFKQKYFFQTLKMLSKTFATGKMSINDFLNLLWGQRKVVKLAGNIRAHWGPICVHPEIIGKPKGGSVMLLLTRRSLSELRQRNIHKLWSVVDVRNHKSLGLMDSLKFKFGGDVALFGKVDKLFTCEF